MESSNDDLRHCIKEEVCSEILPAQLPSLCKSKIKKLEEEYMDSGENRLCDSKSSEFLEDTEELSDRKCDLKNIPIDVHNFPELITNSSNLVELNTNSDDCKVFCEPRLSSVRVPIITDEKTKKYACYYCSKLLSKIARHLWDCHSKEKEMKEIQGFKSRNEINEAQLNLDKLRNLGNFKHNTSVLEQGEGSIIVSRTPKSETDATAFIPCVHCYGFFHKKDLRNHVQVCKFRGDSVNDKPILSGQQLLLPFLCPNSCTDLQKHILSHMKQDEISYIVRSDSSLLTFGTSLLNESGPDQYDNISQRLRQLARLLLSMKRPANKPKLIEILRPENFPFLLQHIKHLTSRNNFPKSLPVQIGPSLKKCAVVLKDLAFQKDDQTLGEMLQEFIRLYDVGWIDQITSPHWTNNNHENGSTEGNVSPQDVSKAKEENTLKRLEEEREFEGGREDTCDEVSNSYFFEDLKEEKLSSVPEDCSTLIEVIPDINLGQSLEDTASKSVSESESMSKSELESKFESKSNFKSKYKTKSKSKLKSKSKSKSKYKSEWKSKCKSKSESKSKSKLKSKSGSSEFSSLKILNMGDEETKRHACFFCSKLLIKIGRHLLDCHETEKEVKEIRRLKPRRQSRLRHLKLDKLRNQGDFRHNTRVLEKGKGIIIVVRMPKNEANVSSFVPCIHCLGFYHKNDLRNHVLICKFAGNSTNENPILEGKQLLLPFISPESELFNEINSLKDLLPPESIPLQEDTRKLAQVDSITSDQLPDFLQDFSLFNGPPPNSSSFTRNKTPPELPFNQPNPCDTTPKQNQFKQENSCNVNTLSSTQDSTPKISLESSRLVCNNAYTNAPSFTPGNSFTNMPLNSPSFLQGNSFNTSTDSYIKEFNTNSTQYTQPNSFTLSDPCSYTHAASLNTHPHSLHPHSNPYTSSTEIPTNQTHLNEDYDINVTYPEPRTFTMKQNGIKKKRWDPVLKEKALKHFKGFIQRRKTPGKFDCQVFLDQHCSVDRSWVDVKNLVKNSYYWKMK